MYEGVIKADYPLFLAMFSLDEGQVLWHDSATFGSIV